MKIEKEGEEEKERQRGKGRRWRLGGRDCWNCLLSFTLVPLILTMPLGLCTFIMNWTWVLRECQLGRWPLCYLSFGDPVPSLWLLTFEAGVRTPRSPSVGNGDWNQRSSGSLPNPKPMDSPWGDQL